MFNALGVDFRAALTPETILAGWTDDSPVKFFPIRRDEDPQRAPRCVRQASAHGITLSHEHSSGHAAWRDPPALDGRVCEFLSSS